VGSQFGIDPGLWDRNWVELSGGEGQRIMMAIGVALGTAEVLLLDGEFFRSSSSLHPLFNDYRIRRHFSDVGLEPSVDRADSFVGRLFRGPRTYLRPGPGNRAGRGGAHLVDASRSGEHS
jgi:hypothetical protein